MPFPYEEFDLSEVTTYPLAGRASKVKAEDFAKPHVKGSGAAALLDGLPNILGAADLRAVAHAIVEARRSGGGIIWGFGAHVIKTGPVADPRRSRRTRVRVGVRDQWRRHHPRLRDRAGGLDIGGRRRGARAGAVRHGRRNRAAAERRHQRTASPEASASASQWRVPGGREAAVRARQCRVRVGAPRHPADGPRRARHRHHSHAPGGLRGGHRRGQPPRLPLLRVQRGETRPRRVSQLRVGRRPARSVPQGRGPGAQPRASRSRASRR